MIDVGVYIWLIVTVIFTTALVSLAIMRHFQDDYESRLSDTERKTKYLLENLEMLKMRQAIFEKRLVKLEANTAQLEEYFKLKELGVNNIKTLNKVMSDVYQEKLREDNFTLLH